MKVRKENFNEIKKRLQEQFTNKEGEKKKLESDQSKDKRNKKFKKDKKNKKAEKFWVDTDGNKAEKNEPVQEDKTLDNEKEEESLAKNEQNSVKKKKKTTNNKNKNNVSVGATTSINLEKFVEKSNTEENKKSKKRCVEDNEEVEAVSEKKIKKPKREKKKKNTESNNSEENTEEKSENENGEPPKKKGPSIREIKRQKAEQRFQEAQNASKQKHSKDALNYISMWKHAKSEWKFNKVKQTWLMNNLLNENYVPEEHYSTILEYFEGCKGYAKKLLMNKAMAVIKKLEDSVEEGEEIIETVEYKRARHLLQTLPNET